MNTRLHRLVKISAAALALAGSLATTAAPARANIPVGPIFVLKLPDLVIDGWKPGKMWSGGTSTSDATWPR